MKFCQKKRSISIHAVKRYGNEQLTISMTQINSVDFDEIILSYRNSMKLINKMFEERKI